MLDEARRLRWIENLVLLVVEVRGVGRELYLKGSTTLWNRHNFSSNVLTAAACTAATVKTQALQLKIVFIGYLNVGFIAGISSCLRSDTGWCVAEC
ncbi:hypothetical protein P8452_42494 [Trifolium repens]|nr:hypothetical protein P8452_42494 [Trifolium repens]